MRPILVVEDNPVNRRLLETILAAENVPSISLENGDGVCEVIEQEDVSLVLMDIQMPVVDGYMALAAIRAHSAISNTTVVAVTGNATDADRELMIERGFDDIVLKPFRLKEMIELVHRYKDG